MAVILLILAGMAVGVIGSDNDIGARDAHVSGGKQRVSSHIQSHMLHGANGTGAGHRGAVSNLGGNLLIGSPFAVNCVPILGYILQNLSAGSAGVGRANLDACLKNTAGGRFITGHQMFCPAHNDPSFRFFMRNDVSGKWLRGYAALQLHTVGQQTAEGDGSQLGVGTVGA